MLLKNHGFRTKQSAITSCLVLHTMKFDTRKVGNVFVPLLFFRLSHIFQVIHQCALERDLELFDAGDKTEVGERGLTLRLASCK